MAKYHVSSGNEHIYHNCLLLIGWGVLLGTVLFPSICMLPTLSECQFDLYLVEAEDYLTCKHFVRVHMFTIVIRFYVCISIKC